MNRLKRLNEKSIVIVITLAACLTILTGQTNQALAASCTPTTQAYGHDSVKLNFPAAGNYAIWTRLKQQKVSGAGLNLNIDGAHCFNIGQSSTSPLNTWLWVNFKDGNPKSVIILSFTKGTHTFLYTGQLNLTEIDRIIAVPQNACKPVGTGANCASFTVGSAVPPTAGAKQSSGKHGPLTSPSADVSNAPSSTGANTAVQDPGHKQSMSETATVVKNLRWVWLLLIGIDVAVIWYLTRRRNPRL